MIIYWIILVVHKFKQSHAGDMKIIVCKFVTFAHVCLFEGLTVKLNDRETRLLNGFVPFEKTFSPIPG